MSTKFLSHRKEQGGKTVSLLMKHPEYFLNYPNLYYNYTSIVLNEFKKESTAKSSSDKWTKHYTEFI